MNSDIPKSQNMSPKTAKAIATSMLPLVVLPLVRKGIITAKHLDDPRTLLSVFMKNLRKGTRKVEWCPAIDETFLNEGVRLWTRGERLIAVVLYATAVEQYLNSMYQHILPTQGWTPVQITCLLREVGVESKVDWMFEVFTKRRFPVALRKRLRTVFGVRNAIVHFKGELGPMESEQDSHSKVEAQMRGLRRVSFSRDYRLLSETFTDALLRCDPDRRIVLQACQLLIAERTKRA